MIMMTQDLIEKYERKIDDLSEQIVNAIEFDEDYRILFGQRKAYIDVLSDLMKEEKHPIIEQNC